MGLHCLTIPNCQKSWALISWQFLLVIVLSFTTIDEDSDYYNKRNGYIHLRFMFSTKHIMALVIKSTVAMRRFF